MNMKLYELKNESCKSEFKYQTHHKARFFKMDHIPLRQIILDSYNQINKKQAIWPVYKSKKYIFFPINKKSGSALPSPQHTMSLKSSLCMIA